MCQVYSQTFVEKTLFSLGKTAFLQLKVQDAEGRKTIILKYYESKTRYPISKYQIPDIK